MPEKNQTPIEMLDQNAAVVQSAEVPARLQHLSSCSSARATPRRCRD